MPTEPRIYTDPSIRDCAIALEMEAMEHINRRVRNGETFYAARTATLASLADEWVALYGKECADKAVRGLHCLAPEEVLDRDTRRAARDQRVARCRHDLATLDPTRNTWINRLCLSWFGMRLYLVPLAILLALPLAPPAEAAPARGKWHALALCGVAKPGPARERACRPFTAAERGTWRGYDHRAGTPRSWELPRAWEIAE